MVRKTITTDIRGTPCGTTYNDKELLEDPETSLINRIVLIHDQYVNSLAVYYNGSNSTVEHRGTRTTGATDEILLVSGEFITMMTGQALPQGTTVGQLEFTSNRGKKWGPFGSATKGEVFKWDYSGTRMGLLYLTSSFLTCLGHIQATFAEYAGASTAFNEVKYEYRTTWQPAHGVPPSLSLFARHLMSPIIVLQAGPTPVTFRAYEGIICRLPFFQAALHSGFRESTDNVIALPEDDPDTVASLLEFLYLGTYTYTYATDGDPPAEVPAKDLAEASFHVRLHALASKYDCAELVALQRHSIANALEDLNSMQVVMVVKEMYESGWGVKDWDEESMGGVKRRIPGIMKELYTSYEEELESLCGGCPGLAQELLRLVVLG